MTVKSRLRQAANQLLIPFGFEIQRYVDPNNPPNHDMLGALAMCKRQGIAVETFIDVGASNGCWSQNASTVYGGAQFLMVEALEERRADLERFVATDPQRRFRYVLAAAGEAPGETTFRVSGDLDGSGLASESDANGSGVRKVPVITVDGEIQRSGLKGPYCLKLDTHGFEVPILKGATNVLASCSLVIIEAYNFKLGPYGVLFWQLCELMDRHGFRVLDLADVMIRPHDGLFWQCDLFFARKDCPNFKHGNYR